LWRWLIALSLFALLAVAAASAFGGYFSGINRRTSFESTQVAQKVSEQYQLGLQDLEAGHYELARQRFEYVIQLDPAYPGVTDQLALVLLELNTTATPTPVPSPTLTPTLDTRGAEELFSQAQILLVDNKWTEAIDNLLKLRKDEPAFQPVEVDSMLYVALRNRGVQRILSESDLEGGTYDLALAERFGPLDYEASNYRDWANLYVTGASFWGLDWQQALFYFEQLLQVAPNLRDATTLTASERYRLALLKYGDFLADSGDWCAAQDVYDRAYNFGSDPSIEPTLTKAASECDEGRNRDNDDDDDEQPTEPPPTDATPTTPPPATTEPPPPATTEPPPATTQPPYPNP
jgi:tetratricopeptide (TPR) repeat protein